MTCCDINYQQTVNTAETGSARLGECLPASVIGGIVGVIGGIPPASGGFYSRWSGPARTNSARIAARTGFSGRAYFYSRLPNHAVALLHLTFGVSTRRRDWVGVSKNKHKPVDKHWTASRPERLPHYLSAQFTVR